MTDEAVTGTESQPVLVERGRYAVSEMPDGSWVIARAGPLCDTCAGCGCGGQADPIVVPAYAVQMMKGMQNGERTGMLKQMRAMMGGG